MSQTARHKLPLLSVSQAQKEITHNEALIRIDALLHAVAQSELSVPPLLTDAEIGKCWLVGASPSGEWVGKTDQLAVWIGGAWRYCPPVGGMRLRVQATGLDKIYTGSDWAAAPTIADPANGTVIDAEARQAIVMILSYLRSTGLVAS